MSDTDNTGEKQPMSTKKKVAGAAAGVGLVGALAAGGLQMSTNVDTSTKDENAVTQGDRSVGGNDNSTNVNTGDVTTTGAVTFGGAAPKEDK